jgi:hypothetical protein
MRNVLNRDKYLINDALHNVLKGKSLYPENKSKKYLDRNE